MKNCILFFIIGMLVVGKSVIAQIPAKVIQGQLLIDDGSPILRAAKYKPAIDSLDKNLKANPNDTTSLFYRALLYDQFNNQLAKPSYSDNDASSKLTVALDLCEKAIGLKMRDFRLLVLRAQIYRDLVYRYSGDESWKFNTKQIAERRNLFNYYKDLANTYYGKLETLDKVNAHNYHNLMISSKYRL
jgi:hypothetical protein